MTKYNAGPGKPRERWRAPPGTLRAPQVNGESLRRVKEEESSPRRVSPRLKQFLMNPPEIELCLLLSRAQLSPQAWERALELLTTPLRWESLLGRAKAFSLCPLVYTPLSAGVTQSSMIPFFHSAWSRRPRKGVLAGLICGVSIP